METNEPIESARVGIVDLIKSAQMVGNNEEFEMIVALGCDGCGVVVDLIKVNEDIGFELCVLHAYVTELFCDEEIPSNPGIYKVSGIIDNRVDDFHGKVDVFWSGLKFTNIELTTGE